VRGAETGELPHRLAVGTAGIGIADMRAEEVARIRVRASGRAVKMEGRDIEVGRWIVISLKVSCSLLLLSALA
jgi:hypothetical protein